MFKEKVNKLIEKYLKGSNKKTMENLVVFLVLLVITVISVKLIWGKNETDKKKELYEEKGYAVLANNLSESNKIEENEYNLEKELEKILSNIAGVGKVQVMITYSETSQVIAMQNEVKNLSKTEETDSNRRNKSY